MLTKSIATELPRSSFCVDRYEALRKYQDRTLGLAVLGVIAWALMIVIGCGLISGCSHPKPSPPFVNRAIEYVVMQDQTARCEDWGRGKGVDFADSAICQSGQTLFWCVALASTKPHCDPIVVPPPKKEDPKPLTPAPKVEAKPEAAPVKETP